MTRFTSAPTRSGSQAPLQGRRVALFVLGTSPAVITETLYALFTLDVPFVPDEVHVVTTTVGAQAVDRDVLNGGSGAYWRLLDEHQDRLGGKTPLFDLERTVHLIRSPRQQEALSDIVTLEDNRAAAKTIYQVLRDLKRVPGTTVHASVAGGRKTMSSYMGQAFSLLADPDDVLTHVLVNEPFERTKPTFFYPPRQPVELHADRWPGPVSTAQAELTLAELSVLKLGPLLRTALPASVLDDFDGTTMLAKGLLEPFEVRPAVLEPARGVKLRPVLRMLGRQVELTPLQYVVFLLHAVALNMKQAGRLDDDAFGFGNKDQAVLTLADWGALCDLDEIPLSPQEVDEPAPNFTVYSKLVDRLRTEVGEVAERLRLVRVLPEADTNADDSPAGAEVAAVKRYRFTERVPTLNLNTLLSPPSRAVVEALVERLVKGQ
jgi:CRISPR-associated protein (TIGR02584 family)